MTAFVDSLTARDADRVALDDGSVRLSRAELAARIARVQRGLRGELGLSAGDPVAILATNSADWLVVLLAAAFAGHPPVPVNTYLRAGEIAYILSSSQAKALFADRARRAVADEAAGGDVAVVDLEGEDFERFGEGSEALVLPAETPFAGTIYYTSGTTGRPKGARMAMVPTGVPVPEYLRQLAPLAELMGMNERTVHLVQGPLYHAAPQVGAATTLSVGGTCVVMRTWDAEEVLRLVERHRVTSTIMVPTMFVRLLRLPEANRARYDLSSLERVTHTAALCPVEVKRAMIEWWGPVIIDGYGASEIGAITQISAPEWLERPGSVGKPLPLFAVQILDDEGRELPPGEVGQVWITGLTGLDIAYLGEPEQTAAAHRGERQFTLGDLGWLDADGYLYLADRRADLIISGGVNIYPAEVEAALLAHPAVDDAAVFGIPDAEWGQQVKAAVCLRPGNVASPELEASLREWLTERIAPFKVPRSIDFHDHLPRYPNGKLHRRELRDPYWQQAQPR